MLSCVTLFLFTFDIYCDKINLYSKTIQRLIENWKGKQWQEKK